jgi:tetratricopeptide (TPR) repeat protein
MRTQLALLALVSVCAAGTARAEDKGAPREVPKDPNGVKGVSPFWESVAKGDSAYVARDFEGAVRAYRDAITSAPQNALGHYRIGEAHLAKGDPKEAEQAWVAALRYVGEDHTLRGKILFVLSDLRERQKLLDDANDSWTKYEEFAREKPEAKTYPATAADRKQKIADRKKMLEDYGAVKKRIEQRLAEATEKAKKSAQ